MIFSILTLFTAATAQAQQPSVTDDEVNEVASKLYCPVCENIPLEACGTAACIQWRDEIRVQLEEGASEDEIIASFVNRFGDRVVGTPQSPFLRALALVTPWLLGSVMLGIGLVTFWRWRKTPPDAQPVVDAPLTPAPAGDAAPLSDEDYRARIEYDLRQRR